MDLFSKVSIASYISIMIVVALYILTYFMCVIVLKRTHYKLYYTSEQWKCTLRELVEYLLLWVMPVFVLMTFIIFVNL